MDKGLIGMANSANISLSALRDGQRARVAALHLSGGMRRRVQDLGLVPGTRVTCVRRALSGDPIAYRIRGAVVALRKWRIWIYRKSGDSWMGLIHSW